MGKASRLTDSKREGFDVEKAACFVEEKRAGKAFAHGREGRRIMKGT